MEYRELAESNGISKWRRVPALNTDERFITDMADIVVSESEKDILRCSKSRRDRYSGRKREETNREERRKRHKGRKRDREGEREKETQTNTFSQTLGVSVNN